MSDETIPSSTEPDHVLRVEKNQNYKTIALYAIQDDDRLSWKAKGLFVYLLSRPDGRWQFYVGEIRSHATDGEDATRAALEELEDAGYLKRVRTRNPDGTFGRYHWTISEVPKRSWAAQPRDIPPDGIIQPGKSTSGLSSPENPVSMSSKDVSSQDVSNEDGDTPERAGAREGGESEGGTEGYSEGSDEREATVEILTADEREEATDALEVAWCGADRGYRGATPDKALAQWAGLLNRGYSHDKVLSAMLGLAAMRKDRHERLEGWPDMEPGRPFNPNVLLTDTRGELLIEVAATYFHKHGPPTGDSGGRKRRPPPDKYRCGECGSETVNPDDGCPVCGADAMERAS